MSRVVGLGRGKRERDDSGVQLAQPPRAAPNLREREEQLRQRAELIRQQRALQRRQQEERTVADEAVRPVDTTAASATNGGVPSNDLMELEELAADDAPARAIASTPAPSSIPVAVWSTVDTTTDATGTTAAPQAMPPSFGSSAAGHSSGGDPDACRDFCAADRERCGAADAVRAGEEEDERLRSGQSGREGNDDARARPRRSRCDDGLRARPP
jgi:hypothetical protein